MKPGFKTTEFWLSIAAASVGGLMAAGVFQPESWVLQRQPLWPLATQVLDFN